MLNVPGLSSPTPIHYHLVLRRRLALRVFSIHTRTTNSARACAIWGAVAKGEKAGVPVQLGVPVIGVGI